MPNTKEIQAQISTANLTTHGKYLIARSMYVKASAFLASSILLEEKQGHEFVVLHLFCQGTEILLKSLLLLKDYEVYKPKLRGLGHDLEKLVTEVSNAWNIKPLRPKIQKELELLNSVYKKHLLRYSSSFDLLIGLQTISSRKIKWRVLALLHLLKTRKVFG